MKRLAYLLIVLTIFHISTISRSDSGQELPSVSTLRRNGAYGFPQQQAIVLCDRPNLRVSLYNSNHSLYVQSILWNDGDASIGKTRNGEEVGDYSVLMLHIGNSSSRTPRKR